MGAGPLRCRWISGACRCGACAGNRSPRLPGAGPHRGWGCAPPSAGGCCGLALRPAGRPACGPAPGPCCRLPGDHVSLLVFVLGLFRCMKMYLGCCLRRAILLPIFRCAHRLPLCKEGNDQCSPPPMVARNKSGLVLLAAPLCGAVDLGLGPGAPLLVQYDLQKLQQQKTHFRKAPEARPRSRWTPQRNDNGLMQLYLALRIGRPPLAMAPRGATSLTRGRRWT